MLWFSWWPSIIKERGDTRSPGQRSGVKGSRLQVIRLNTFNPCFSLHAAFWPKIISKYFNIPVIILNVIIGAPDLSHWIKASESDQNSCPTFPLSKCHAYSYISSAVLARELFLTVVLTTHASHSCLFDSTHHSYFEWNDTGLQSLSQRES